MNILLITYNNDIENPDVFKDRINALGDTFYVFENAVFVETALSTQEVFEKISISGYERNQMLVLHVKNEMLGFWGRMKTTFWTWLSEREERTKDGLNESYIREISVLSSEKMELEEKIRVLQTEEEEYKKTIENQYQQIEILQQQIKR